MRTNVSHESLIGQKFGRLTVIAVGELKGHSRMMICECECGVVKPVNKHNLRIGDSASCGCLQKDMIAFKSANAVQKLHPVEYNTWVKIKARCLNPKDKCYFRYGGKGITMCERWVESFHNFLIDMGKRPADKCSIDRIDNNGNYTPENCRWADMTEQCRNRSVSVYLEHNGQRLTLKEWEPIVGVKYKTLHFRYKKGWPTEKILSPTLFP